MAQVKLIEDLGGTRAVAEIVNAALFVGILPNAVAMWRLRGIPFFYHRALVDVARMHGITVPDDLWQ